MSGENRRKARKSLMELEKFLIEYNKKGIYPMHMPGHKRNLEIVSMSNPYAIDVTEAGELDNMHQPVGILAECMDYCAYVFGSKRTFYLINGSTGGILSAISAAVSKGGKILMSRACHKSVYNAVYLRELEPAYIYPPTDQSFGIYGSISPDEVKKHLEANPDIELVVITSPTYEGVVSDIKSIAEICHGFGVPLMVDAAHGAHFGFAKGLPERAIALGADISVESIHKTLPSFTQTSLLHFNSDLISLEKLKQFLTIYQTTSPSYILMSGIDKCVRLISGEEGERLFDAYIKRLDGFSRQMERLKKIRILCKGADCRENHAEIYDFDSGKIVISVRGSGITGADLEKILVEDYGIQLEMSLGDYGIAMSSVCDTDEGFKRLAEALLSLDQKLCENKGGGSHYERLQGYGAESVPKNEIVMKCSEAMEAEREIIGRADCADRISQEYLYAYPPGIPLVVPGERISAEMLSYIKSIENMGTEIYSTSGAGPESISVLK